MWVSQVIDANVCPRGRMALCACRLIASATRTTCSHLAHGVDANDVRAAEDRRRHRGGRAPVALRRRRSAEGRP